MRVQLILLLLLFNIQGNSQPAILTLTDGATVKGTLQKSSAGITCIETVNYIVCYPDSQIKAREVISTIASANVPKDTLNLILKSMEESGRHYRNAGIFGLTGIVCSLAGIGVTAIGSFNGNNPSILAAGVGITGVGTALNALAFVNLIQGGRKNYRVLD